MDRDRWAALRRLGLLGLVLLVLLGLGLWLDAAGELSALIDPQRLQRAVDGLGVAGPLVLIGLLALNVVVSPIPSGPMLLAAGAAYGPWLGSAIGLIGVQAGSLIAFSIARRFGADAVRRLAGERALDRLEGSELALAGIVLVSRLVPFVSFDVVSWGAGLTPLRTSLFALANLVGILPITVVLVLVGDGLIAGIGDGSLVAGSAVVLSLAFTLLGGWRLIVAGRKPRA